MADQLSLVDALGTLVLVLRIDALIDCSRLDYRVGEIRTADTGRPPYRALAMLKALYLQALYDLSYPGLEEALLDWLSFRRFCGFGLDEGTPDETTLCRFRLAVARAGLLERCFADVTLQLEARGLMLKKGTLMDASMVAATHNPPAYEAGPGAPHPREPGADWTRKGGVGQGPRQAELGGVANGGGKSFFGYKLHIGVDEGSGLIRKAVVTPARTLDNEVAEELISGDEAAVYADRIYESKARRAALKARGIKDRIMHRRQKHMPVLTRWMTRRNMLIARCSPRSRACLAP